MMGIDVTVVLLLSGFLFFPDHLFAHPLCTDSRAPVTVKSPLTFCSYGGSACCNATQDDQLQKQFQKMNISDSECASMVKSILCAICDPFSGELFTVESMPRSFPVLCNSTVSGNSSQSNQAQSSFCSKLWDTCQNVSILGSPFAPSLRDQVGLPVNTSNSSQLNELWKSKSEFCYSVGGASADGSLCFDGEPVTFNASGTPSSPAGLCFEKIGNESYLNMVPHPDGSNRALFANQAGKVWLASIPKPDSGGMIKVDVSNPFLDLSDEVHLDAEFGLLGIALHPDFSQNGRLFASFNCDKSKWPGCSGRCACNSDINCDPSKLSSDNGAQPCQYQSVIAEYTANGTASEPNLATSAKPTEVRRIFTMGLPFSSHHGGQILFGPTDGYLYYMMGDGGSSGDPYNFSQNKKSLLGKIMRFDVDNFPSETEINKLGLWGNYSIPKDNPYVQDKDLEPEIWALGFRNPWRCSFDSERPSYFMCADVGQDSYEEVDIICKGGNYGWRVYEGPYLYHPTQSPGGNTSLSSINPSFPVMGYNHSAVNEKVGSASITGGYFYRSSTDPCMYGRYLYADLYGDAMWEGIEFPEDSGNFITSEIPFNCASDSPMKCSSVEGSSVPSFGYIFSYGEDNNKDIYILAYSGVYRVVRPSRCKYKCSMENAKTVSTSGPSPSPHPSPAASSNSSHLICDQQHYKKLMILFSFLLFFMFNDV